MADEKKTDDNLLEFVRENVVGRDAVFKGPYGARKLIYCDYTASGKPLEYIEKYISEHVYPFYANTHTTTSVSGLQTSEFRASARRLIKKSVHASDEDVVIFTGSGVTAAVHKLIHAIQLEGEVAKNTVVMVGPYEHHSNILPWKETGATVERILDQRGGTPDMEMLEAKLKEYKEKGFQIIVSFSAASNITGIITDTEAVAALTHKYGGLSFWDYATAAPYLEINMNPGGDSYKDAVFISPHKFVGGVGTPGVLVAKKHLFRNPVPGGVGGGTVVYVTKETHEYHKNIEEREEGGTPAIVESIRAGMVFQIKDAIGANVIEGLEEDLSHSAFSRWRRNRCIHLLGSYTARRIPIFSMMIFHPESGKYVHHNFISALLNDLYGIQVRGGCACSGPYAQDLMDMDEKTALVLATEFLTESRKDKSFQKMEVMKPGFVRLNLPYFMDKETTEFILEAVDTVATHGWKLLPQYKFDPVSGEWQHRSNQTQIRHLEDIKLGLHGVNVPEITTLEGKGHVTLQQVREEVAAILENVQKASEASGAMDDPDLPVKEELKNIVWFITPKQAAMYLKSPFLHLMREKKDKLPMWPRHKSLLDVKAKFSHALLKAERLGVVKKYNGHGSGTELHILDEVSHQSDESTLQAQVKELSAEVITLKQQMTDAFQAIEALQKELKSTRCQCAKSGSKCNAAGGENRGAKCAAGHEVMTSGVKSEAHSGANNGAGADAHKPKPTIPHKPAAKWTLN